MSAAVWEFGWRRPDVGYPGDPPVLIEVEEAPSEVADITARIERREVLGGLISEYSRAA